MGDLLDISRLIVYVSIALLATFPRTVRAQTYTAGIKLGPSLNWTAFGDRDDKQIYKNRPRIGGSVMAEINFPLKNAFGLHIEAGGSRTGRRILFNNKTWENRATYYFADGAMILRREFELNLGPNIPGHWYFGLGPHINYWISGSGKFGAVGDPRTSYTVVFNQEPTGDFNKMYLHDVNRWLFGLDFALGFDAPIRKGQTITTELRFMSGHTFLGEKESAVNTTLGFEDDLAANVKGVCITVSYQIHHDRNTSRMGKSNMDKIIKRKPRKR